MYDKITTIEEFYKNYPELASKHKEVNGGGKGELGHFNVFERKCYHYNKVSYSRRDFFKAALITGAKGTINYADKSVKIENSVLLFSNPRVPYSWEITSDEQGGYFCLFTKEFVTNGGNIHLSEHPLFKVGGDPIYFVNDEQTEYLSGVYRKMLEEIKTDYIYKYDLLRNYLDLIIHQALKLKPAESYYEHANASSRITTLFIELLERQFPIDSTENILRMKKPSDYAENLSMHVNHLNHAVKEVTGKTTTQLIAARIVREAQAMLKHTDWNISEIAYSLGFEYPTYFTNFFKKHTKLTPNAVRR